MRTITLELKKTPAELAKLCQQHAVFSEGWPGERRLSVEEEESCPLRGFVCPIPWGCGEVSASDWEEVLNGED